MKNGEISIWQMQKPVIASHEKGAHEWVFALFKSGYHINTFLNNWTNRLHRATHLSRKNENTLEGLSNKS